MWCNLYTIPRANPEKKRKEIEKLQAKDKSWLVEKLFAARHELKFVREEYGKGSAQNSTLSNRADILRAINANMAAVLAGRGLSPTQYIVKYNVWDCANCKAHWDDEDEGEQCDEYWPYDESCPKRSDVKTMSLWGFDLENSILTCIESDFQGCEIPDVVSISTTNGHVIYQKKDDDKEDTQQETKGGR